MTSVERLAGLPLFADESRVVRGSRSRQHVAPRPRARLPNGATAKRRAISGVTFVPDGTLPAV
jgi:hypothetical protein